MWQMKDERGRLLRVQSLFWVHDSNVEIWRFPFFYIKPDFKPYRRLFDINLIILLLRFDCDLSPEPLWNNGAADIELFSPVKLSQLFDQVWYDNICVIVC